MSVVRSRRAVDAGGTAAGAGAVTTGRSGATLFQDVPAGKTTEYYEKKYQDPDGIIFDITHSVGLGAGRQQLLPLVVAS